MTSRLMSVKRQVIPVTTPIKRFQVLDPRDVVPCLGKRDALPLAAPGVDVLLAGVVGGERRALVSVLVQQMAQVPRAVADVDLGVVEIGDPEARAARVDRDPLGRVRQQLHQADRAGARARVRVELALLVDDAGQERRVGDGGQGRGGGSVVASVAADDRAVVERVAQAHVPRGRGRVHVSESASERGADEQQRQELLHVPSSSSTPATNASRSSSEPSFTYEKSACATLTVSGSRRCSRPGSSPPRRPARTSSGAVIATTTSKRSWPPTSYRSGTSVTLTAGGRSSRASCSRHSRYSFTTSGCSSASSPSG